MADEPIVNQGDMERKNRKVKDTQNMLQLLDSESAACIAQSTTAIEVLKGHLDKCIPSVHGQHALSNAFMQACPSPKLFQTLLDFSFSFRNKVSAMNMGTHREHHVAKLFCP